MEIMKRADARRKRLDKYFTGQPCRNGHLAERYSESGVCTECNRRERAAIGTEINEFDPRVTAKIETLKSKIYLLEQAEKMRLERVRTMNVERVKREQLRASYIEFKNTLADEDIYKLCKEPVLRGDLQAAQAIVLKYSLMRDMRLTLDDLWPARQNPKLGVLYTFKCHVDDEIAIRQELQTLYNKIPMAKRHNAVVPDAITPPSIEELLEYVEPTPSIFDVTDDTFMS
jgi:hypothetical protein